MTKIGMGLDGHLWYRAPHGAKNLQQLLTHRGIGFRRLHNGFQMKIAKLMDISLKIMQIYLMSLLYSNLKMANFMDQNLL